MLEGSGVDAAQLSEAIVVWTGWGRFAWPRRDDTAVVTSFGAERAAVLLPLVHDLWRDFYSSEAYRLASDLAEIGKRAAADFHARHPSLPEDAITALAWCYTFDWK